MCIQVPAVIMYLRKNILYTSEILRYNIEKGRAQRIFEF